MNDAFLSVVEHHDPAKYDLLTVRARRSADITNVFPTARVYTTPQRDYGYRAYVKRGAVAKVIAARITGIDYGNFKDSVKERSRHDAYLEIWTTMMRWGRGLKKWSNYSHLDAQIDDDLGAS